MKFSCEKALLQSAISTTSRATAAKSSIPALEGILLEAGEDFDLVFLDPPYASGLLEEMLGRITAPGFDILHPYGIIVAEHPADRRLAVPAGYRLRKTYRYGKIAVTLFRREGNE